MRGSLRLRIGTCASGGIVVRLAHQAGYCLLRYERKHDSSDRARLSSCDGNSMGSSIAAAAIVALRRVRARYERLLVSE